MKKNLFFLFIGALGLIMGAGCSKNVLGTRGSATKPFAAADIKLNYGEEIKQSQKGGFTDSQGRVYLLVQMNSISGELLPSVLVNEQISTLDYRLIAVNPNTGENEVLADRLLHRAKNSPGGGSITTEGTSFPTFISTLSIRGVIEDTGSLILTQTSPHLGGIPLWRYDVKSDQLVNLQNINRFIMEGLMDGVYSPDNKWLVAARADDVFNSFDKECHGDSRKLWLLGITDDSVKQLVELPQGRTFNSGYCTTFDMGIMAFVWKDVTKVEYKIYDQTKADKNYKWTGGKEEIKEKPLVGKKEIVI